jgi:hypothetical protein
VAGARHSDRGDGAVAPFGEVAVDEVQGNRAAGRLAVHVAGRDAHGIFFNFHAATRAIAKLAAGHLPVQFVHVEH